MISIKDQIAQADDNTVEPVENPPWGIAGLHLRTMTGLERDRWEEIAFPAGKPRDIGYRESLLAFALCDATGSRIYPDQEEQAIARLGTKSNVTIKRLWKQAARMNGLAKSDQETAAKNS